MFLPNAVEIGEAKKRICAEHGFAGVFPMDGDLDIDGLDLPGIGLHIFDRCVAHMDTCDAVIANLTPFRGPSMDVGTAVEIGYMQAQGKPVFGYTNMAADYAARVEPDGLLLEDFGFCDNLMIEGAVVRSGATVVRADVPPDEVLTSLVGFERCVRAAADLLAVAR